MLIQLTNILSNHTQRVGPITFLPIFLSSLLLILILSCQTGGTDPEPEPMDPVDPIDSTTNSGMNDTASSFTFLALGDSYTIGESVEVAERWPNQLADSLATREIKLKVAAPTIVARTGWTTDELMNAIDNTQLEPTYDLVSLLIGVNNQFRGYAFSQYETEFNELLNTALAFANNDNKRVFVVSIPDYGFSCLFGASYNPDKIARELDQYNAYADSVATARGIAFFNITPISREAKDQPDLVAIDRLHPSGLMYTRWVELYVDDVANLLQ